MHLLIKPVSPLFALDKKKKKKSKLSSTKNKWEIGGVERATL